ncbi:hypothetical protein [Geodermatophilus sp. SYSU D00815]
MGEFVDEVTVLSRWLGRDLTAELSGVVPLWHAFRFRDAAVFEPDAGDRLYLVRGQAVRELVVSRGTIDDAYADLTATGDLRAVA